MNDSVKIFLCGDVMTGRGVDQIMAHPVDPVLYESFMKDARGYVRIAEQKNGIIRKPLNFNYIWGDSLNELKKFNPDVRIINLETAITTNEHPWKGKGINYRMNPLNVPCLNVAKIDLCTLANNHIIDWGYEGLIDTLNTLWKNKIKFAGAGKNFEQAIDPEVFTITNKRRVLFYACCLNSSGVPHSWKATEKKPGVNLLDDLSFKSAKKVITSIQRYRKNGDIVIFSIHWGGNWGYDIPRQHILFAHTLIDSGLVDCIHGHSSHHFLAFEVYRNKPVFYGCGDLITDYEGISGHEIFKPSLCLLYFIEINSQNELKKLEMVPFELKQFRLNRLDNINIKWVAQTLNREGQKLGTKVIITEEKTLLYENFNFRK